MIPQTRKTRVTIYLDKAILEQFKNRSAATGKGYQTLAFAFPPFVMRRAQGSSTPWFFPVLSPRAEQLAMGFDSLGVIIVFVRLERISQ